MAGVGQLIRTHRKAAGMSQADIAAATGIDRSTISKLETGTRCASADQLVAIARALDIAAGVLLEPAGLGERGEVSDYDLFRERLLADSSLTLEQKRLLVAIYRQFAGIRSATSV